MKYQNRDELRYFWDHTGVSWDPSLPQIIRDGQRGQSIVNGWRFSKESHGWSVVCRVDRVYKTLLDAQKHCSFNKSVVPLG